MSGQLAEARGSSRLLPEREMADRPRAPHEAGCRAAAARNGGRGAAGRRWPSPGTAITGGPSGASSRAPTMPMSAATSRRSRRKCRGFISEVAGHRQPGRARRRPPGEAGRSRLPGGAGEGRWPRSTAQQAALANLEAQAPSARGDGRRGRAEHRRRGRRGHPHADRRRPLSQLWRASQYASATAPAAGRCRSPEGASRPTSEARAALDAARARSSMSSPPRSSRRGPRWPSADGRPRHRQAQLELHRDRGRRSTASSATAARGPAPMRPSAPSCMSLVPAHGLWVDANFKENQIARMRPGHAG